MNVHLGQSFERGSFSTEDPSELEMAVQPWDLMVDCQNSKGQQFELDFVRFSGLSVTRESYGHDAHLMGMPPPDQLVLAIPFGGDGASTAYGEPVIEHQLYALSDDLLDVRYGGGLTVMMVEVSLDQPFDSSIALAVERLVSRGRQSEIARSHQNMRYLARRLGELFQPATAAVASTSPLGPGMLREAIDDSLVAAVLPEELDFTPGKKVGQKAAVRAALDYLRTSGSECTSVAALCAGAGVNKRTLERGVRDQFDCTVVHLLQKWRLHRARQRLLESGPKDTTVTHIATSLGFYDLGRFASRYRYRFGEYPSDTLSAASRPIAREYRNPARRDNMRRQGL